MENVTETERGVLGMFRAFGADDSFWALFEKYPELVPEMISVVRELADGRPVDPFAICVEILDMPFQSLQLPSRIKGLVFAALRRHHVKIIRDVVQLSETELRRERLIGRKTVAEIQGALRPYGLRLGMTTVQIAVYEGRL